MDPLNETPFYSILAPQLMWIKILEVCTVVLLALALLTLLVGWLRRLSWRVRLSALPPLVSSVGAGIAAYALHNTYFYWVDFLNTWLPRKYPLGFQRLFLRNIDDANRRAATLGWVGVAVTGILLILGLVGLWLLVMPRRERQQPSASLAIES